MPRRPGPLPTALILALAAMLGLAASAAAAASRPDRQALEGLDAITINTSAGTNAPPECGVTAALARVAVASRTGPVGLKAMDGAPLVANAQVATVFFDKSQLCVSSVMLRIGLFAFYHTDAAPKKERLGEVALINKSGLLSSDAASHPQQVTTLVQRMLDEFVLDWQEANQAAQVGKVGPAAGGDRPAQGDAGRMLVAQKRLQALGLYAGAIDGVMGERTGLAISTFQQARGLPVTGQLDDPTFGLLKQ